MIITEFLYAIGIKIYHFLIFLYALNDPKAQKWIDGRSNQWSKITKVLNPSRKKFWIHCASLGEFEQGRIIIDRLKEAYPDTSIVLTFFSPSGYEVRKNYKNADYVFYLPQENRFNAKRWIKYVNPKLAIFIKYEFWYFYYKELYSKNIPLLHVASVFRPNQPYFQFYRKLLPDTLSCVNHFFVQNNTSKELLSEAGIINNVTVISDTRFDRVNEISVSAKRLPVIESFTAGKEVLVGGSTYETEEAFIQKLVEHEIWTGKVIIAPHNTDDSHIQSIQNRFQNKAICYSEAEEAQNLRDVQVLIIDSVGLLSSIYRYGHLALVGGGFRNTLHNILEPSAMSLPVVMGPKFEKFSEAVDLVNEEAAFPFSTFDELREIIQTHMNSPEQRYERGRTARNYIDKNTGGSEMVIQHIKNLHKKQ